MGSHDTIAAIATAPGRGGVAVLRLSGPDAFTLAERLTGKAPQPGRFLFTRFRHPADGSLLDEGLVLFFKGPHSYTGEDVVELQCHGGTVTPRRLLEACFSAGARPARRGEFTERAFLNGRLDYDQAESVLDLIDAKTARSADAALAGLTGAKTRALCAVYEAVLALSSTVEHALDVDESDLPDDFLPGVTASLRQVWERVAVELRRAREGKLLREGALVVLAGAPNAGKSSLLNALLGEKRAIVSDVAGTTRDAIDAWVDFGGWPIRLVDTAGLRETTDGIEAEGVRRAEALMKEADVIVRLVPMDAEEVAPDASDPRELVVRSKGDLVDSSDGKGSALVVSTKTGEGLATLRQAVVTRLETKAEATADVGTDADRLVAVLSEALGLLPETADDLVLVGNALARVAAVLGEPLGAVYSEDLLTALFSRFCVGK